MPLINSVYDLASTDADLGDALITVVQPFASAVETTQHTKNSERISVKDFGATGDGSTDDTAAVQAAVNEAGASGRDVYFPAGTYRINLVIPSTVTNYRLYGERGRTIIKPAVSTAPTISDCSDRTWSYARIENLIFYGYTLGSQVGIGFMFGPLDWDGTGTNYANRGRVVFSFCDFIYLDKGIYKKYGNIGNKYVSCRFAYNNYGVLGQGNKVNGSTYPIMHSGNDTYDVCEFDGNKVACTAYLDTTVGAGQWTYRQCVFQYNEGFGTFFDFSLSNNLLYRPIILDHCWYEGNGTASSVSIETVSGTQTLAPSNHRVSGALYSTINISSTTDFATQLGVGVGSTTTGRLHIAGDGFFQGTGNQISFGASAASDKAYIQNGSAGDLILHPATSTRSVLITENATLIVGESAGSSAGTHRIKSRLGDGSGLLTVTSANRDCVRFSGGTSIGWGTAAANMFIGAYSGRSVNAAGTVNTGGTDYAEYVLKNSTCGDIPKGGVCGVDVNGLLTDKYDEAVSFVIKTTNPSFVGGDDWFTEEAPERSTKEWFEWDARVRELSSNPDELTPEEYADAQDALLKEEPTGDSSEYTEWEARREAARLKVDRVAFCGQVPCNVLGSSVGDYIVPAPDGVGGITGVAVSSPTFEEYKVAIGKVWKVLPDGTAWVVVKML